MQQNRFNNQKGLTLIEVLASIVILSIIVVTFLTFFTQSAKTTNISEDVLDGSYVAQSHLEEIYFEATNTNFNAFLNTMQNNSDSHQTNNTTETLEQSQGEYQIKTTIKPAKDSGNVLIEDLYSVVVQVCKPSNKLKAQMETKLYFDEQEE